MRFFSLVLIETVALTCSALVLPPQQVLLGTTRKHRTISSDVTPGSRNGSVEKIYTFDDIDLHGNANKTILSHGFLELFHFEVVNVTAASAKGFLHPNDTDSATSKPNTLHSLPTHHASASVIRANATALAAQGLSPYFDVVAFTFKPRGPAPINSGVKIDVWNVDADGKKARLVDGMFTFWQRAGFIPPSKTKPAEYWPGWGEGGNWIEMKGFTIVFGDDGKTEEIDREFFIDDLTLRFQPLDED